MERISIGKKLVSNDRRRRGKVHDLDPIFESHEHKKNI